ncbi:sodium/hydrogen exchanger 3-like isoform X2 [Macrobrachium nipponense]|uniref:sodium/hydrogen exchanger 3-like isoform X2 n=1 Tax=Macrobrachium nipponense TaxID=159736 RepID=UPI0030C88858
MGVKHVFLYVTCVVGFLAYVSANTPTEAHPHVGTTPRSSGGNSLHGSEGGGGGGGTGHHNTGAPSVSPAEHHGTGDDAHGSGHGAEGHGGAGGHGEEGHAGGGHGGDHGGHGDPNKRYPVAVIDFERVQTPFIISLWIFCACLGKIGFHLTAKLSAVFPESCLLIVLGVIIGALLFYTKAASVSPLTVDVFFLYMLPPIILDAGYFMPNRLFFDHLGTILVFAVIGTVWNTMTIGISLYALGLTGLFGVEIPILPMLLFSALISAVDPVAVLAVFEEIHVEEVLYILVFGESLLNDGVTVVLYHIFEGFSEIGESNVQIVDIASGCFSFILVALGGTLVGIIWGFLTAFVTRWTNHVRVIEPIFVFVMSYLAYLNAEIFHLSGILSITFCGITMKNYVEQNVSSKSHTTIKYAMKMLSSSSETVIFMFLGVATIASDHDWNTWFVIFTILFCSVYRILGVLILSAVCNRVRVKKIEFVDKFVMSYGGLRGAIAFALVITINPEHIPYQRMFMTATIAMVYFTVFIQGITIKPLVQMLGVKKAEKRTLTMNERLHERVMDYLMAGIEDVVGRHGNFHIRDKFKRFNNSYLTPFLVRENNVIEPKILETLDQIKMQEAMNYAATNGGSPNQIESFTALLRNALSQVPKKQEVAGEFNLDVGELEYNPTARDINDAKYHHLLSDEYKPMKRHRGSTYKRHAVKDDDVQTSSDVNHHNVYLHTRQYVRNINIRNRKARKPGRVDGGISEEYLSPQEFSEIVQFIDVLEAYNKAENNVKGDKMLSTPQMQYQKNGSAIKLKNDYMEEVLRDNPAFEPDEYDFAPGYQYGNNTEDMPTSARKVQRQHSLAVDEGDDSNTAPTMAEILLPWKRPEDEDICDKPLRQSEFPAWASNKEYVGYYSPSNTFLCGIGIKDQPYPNIRDIFAKRTSSSLSLGSRRGSVKDGLPGSRRGSVKDNIPDSRRSSLKDSVPSSRRGSLKEGSRSNSLKEIPISPLASPTHNQDPSALRRRSSSGDNSLLNTTIAEEDGRRGEYVIDMDPHGSSENTRGIGIKDHLYTNIRDILTKHASGTFSVGSRRGSTKNGFSGLRRGSEGDICTFSRRLSLKDSVLSSRQEFVREDLQINSLEEMPVSPIASPVYNQEQNIIRRRSSVGISNLLNMIAEEDGRREEYIVLVDSCENSENTYM